MSQIPFKDLNLSKNMYKAIEEMGFENSTEIQGKAIPVLIEGRDVLGKSQTGTGKTLAFAIPSIELMDEENLNKVQVLVLCPTRELAMQATSEMIRLCKFKKEIKIVDIYGGTSIERQIIKLKSANVVVGTPGRIMDHIKRRTLRLGDIKIVILDEADEMLSMGFRDDIEQILSNTPKERQTVLFSATMPPEILSLAKKFQKDPITVEVKKKQETAINISQFYYNVPFGRKNDSLKLLMLHNSPNLAMVFCNTKKMVDSVTEFLRINGLKAIGLHGDMQQNQRTNVMNSFKNGQTKILVATDVAARGIDVSDVDLVVNFDIPQNIEYYVHRIGRTGRAGKSGEAITICSGKIQVESLLKICYVTKSKVIKKELPKIEEVVKKQYEKNLSDIKESINSEENKYYEKMAMDLVNQGLNITDIAATALKQCFWVKDKKISEIKPIKAVFTPKSRSFNNFSRDIDHQKISLNVGRLSGIDHSLIIKTLMNITDLKAREIGKIDILDRKSIVSIPRKKASIVLRQMRSFRIAGKMANATPCTR